MRFHYFIVKILAKYWYRLYQRYLTEYMEVLHELNKGAKSG